jgi:hypothetical protein
MRTPDEILADIDFVAGDHPMLSVRELMWEVINDIRNSYDLAMFGTGVPDAMRSEVSQTVSDYLANHYGDD